MLAVPAPRTLERARACRCVTRCLHLSPPPCACIYRNSQEHWQLLVGDTEQVVAEYRNGQPDGQAEEAQMAGAAPADVAPAARRAAPAPTASTAAKRQRT